MSTSHNTASAVQFQTTAFDFPPAPCPTANPATLEEALNYVALLGPADDGTPIPCLRLPNRNEVFEEFKTVSRPLDPEYVEMLRGACGDSDLIFVGMQGPFIVGTVAKTSVEREGQEKALIDCGREIVASITLIDAGKERARLDREHRLNLGALRAFADATGVFDHVTAREPEDWGLKLSRATCRNDNGEIKGFYEYRSLRAITDQVLARENRHLFPWHKGEMKTGVRFSGEGDQETVTALFFVGDDPTPRDPMPLSDVADKTLRPRIDDVRARRNELRQKEAKLRDMAYAFRNVVVRDDAVGALEKLIREGEETVARYRRDLVEAYCALVEILAQHRGIMLTKYQERARKEQVLARAQQVTANARQSFARTPAVIAEMPTLTRMPAPFLFGGIIQQERRIEITRPRYNRDGEKEETKINLLETRGSGNFEEFLEKSRGLLGTDLGWLPLYVMLALYDRPGEVYSVVDGQTSYVVDVGDFYRRTHPEEVEAIKKHGLNGWFAKKYPKTNLSAVDAFVLSIRFLQNLTISTSSVDSGELGGFLFYFSRLPTTPQGRVAILYGRNPLLVGMVSGTTRSNSYYMYSNNEAYFKCPNRKRHMVAPILIYLEYLARGAGIGSGSNRNVTKEGWLEVGRGPTGAPMRFGTLIEKCGFYDDKKGNLFRDVENALRTLQDELHVIAKYVISGSSANLFSCTIQIFMAKEYASFYSITSAERALKTLDRHMVETPLKALSAPTARGTKD